MFKLDDRLHADTYVIGELELCLLLLMNDSRYPWLILVPKLANISEVYQLSEQQQHSLWQETTLISHTLSQLVDAHKMNVATLGNVVNQLHMHVVARHTSDAAWPAPVWGAGIAQPYQVQQVRKIQQQLNAALKHKLTLCEVTHEQA